MGRQIFKTQDISIHLGIFAQKKLSILGGVIDLTQGQKTWDGDWIIFWPAKTAWTW